MKALFRRKSGVYRKDRIIGDAIKGFPHIHFLDNVFLDIPSKSKTDYIIWYAPLKLVNGI